MQTLSRHLVADIFGCPAERISQVEPVRRHMLEAARLVGATVVAHAFHRFQPQGVTGTLIIAESHLSVHTWPEHGYVAIDILTCGDLDPRPGFRYLKEQLGGSEARLQVILRGLPEELGGRGARQLRPGDVLLSETVGPLD